MFAPQEIAFLNDLKVEIFEKIEPFELYQQKELIEMLDISLTTFRKYFSYNDAFLKEALMVHGQKKFYKGYVIRSRMIELSYDTWNIEYEKAIEEVEKILDPFKDRVSYEIKTIQDYEYEEIGSDVFVKFGGYNTENEKKFWNDKLKEKIGVKR